MRRRRVLPRWWRRWRRAPKAALPGIVAGWLDASDASVRLALLKLITGGLRVGASARLAKIALAEIGGVEADDVEEVWHGLAPPYLPLFAWLEKRAPRPDPAQAPVFRPPMLAHPLEAADIAALQPEDWRAEWKWDGIRVQLVATEGGRRLYSRGAEDISGAFPEIVEAMDFHAVLDGELLVVRDGQVAPFADLQQRLNRKIVSARMMADYPGRHPALRHAVRGSRGCASAAVRCSGARGWRRGMRGRARRGWICRS